MPCDVIFLKRKVETDTNRHTQTKRKKKSRKKTNENSIASLLPLSLVLFSFLNISMNVCYVCMWVMSWFDHDHTDRQNYTLTTLSLFLFARMYIEFFTRCQKQHKYTKMHIDTDTNLDTQTHKPHRHTTVLSSPYLSLSQMHI